MVTAKTLGQSCRPRDEVLSGELTDAMFAARLNDVFQGKAHETYQQPEQFFANTYPTEEAKTFLREALGRLSGKDPTANSMFRLGTTFGGGKTHTLIGLYHLVSSTPSSSVLSKLEIDPSIISAAKPTVVTVVGDDLNPSDGVEKGGVRVRVKGGGIMYHLGGRAPWCGV